MDLYALISVLSVMHSWILCTVLSAPTGETPAATQGQHHVRTKRCSCATFLDKECVYFCHLDIIWVNTPEHVVSYGLGNAPRMKRAAAAVAASGPRCRCSRETDATCSAFCSPDSRLGDGTVPEPLIRSAEGDGCVEARCRNKLAADAGEIKRRNISGVENRVSPPAVRAVLKTRLLLEKWRARQRHRARAWEGESAAS